MKKTAILFTLLISVVLGTRAMAGSDWSSAVSLPSSLATPAVRYGSLWHSGSVIFYRIRVTRPMTIAAAIDTPDHQATGFVPQLIVYKPSLVTAGPSLGLPQPPSTLGLVYPTTTPEPLFDIETQTHFIRVLQTTVSLDQPGIAYVAVFNAGAVAGTYRLTLVEPTAKLVHWDDAWSWPMQWWQSQVFSGFGWYTLIIPALVLLTGFAVYLRLDHHHLHPHRQYSKRRSTQRRRP